MLLGLAAVSGCSSDAASDPIEKDDKTEPTKPSGGGNKDAGRPPPEEEPEEEEETGPTCGPKGDELTLEAIDSEIGWKPPAAPSASCSTEEITTIEKAFDTAKTWFDLVAGVSDNCKSCVATKDDQANWGPIVIFEDDGSGGFANFGACYASVDSEACGKALQYAEICLNASCTECEAGTPDDKACIQLAQDKQCKGIIAEVQKSCKNASADTKCSSVIKGIATLCGAAPSTP
jgi:hypothetical protein